MGGYRTSIQAKLHDTKTYVDWLLRTALGATTQYLGTFAPSNTAHPFCARNLIRSQCRATSYIKRVHNGRNIEASIELGTGSFNFACNLLSRMLGDSHFSFRGSIPCPIILHCIALHCTALHCIALYNTSLYSTTLHYTALPTALHYRALTTLHCNTLQYNTLHCNVSRYVTMSKSN